MQILATDGGPHSHTKWAVATAKQVILLDAIKDPDRQLSAMVLQAAVAKALIPHHDAVQQAERAGLAANGDAHFDAEYDPTEHTNAAMATFLAEVKGTEFEEHFSKPEVQQVVGGILASHFATSAHVEREWYGRRNPTSAAGQAFIARHHPGNPEPADEPAADEPAAA